LPRDTSYAVGNFINSILNKKNIEIKSNHKVIRSYMHEYDLSRWLLEIVKNANTNCPIYNVGSDEQVDIRKLALYLSNKYKVGLKLEKINSDFEDRYLPSTLKAKKILNLKLSFDNYSSVSEVIQRIINN